MKRNKQNGCVYCSRAQAEEWMDAGLFQSCRVWQIGKSFYTRPKNLLNADKVYEGSNEHSQRV
jgi:hypothetical protein